MHGQQSFQTYCASCHGESSPQKGSGSIVDGSYLELVSDQSLRDTIIAGRPDLGLPDWRNDLPGHPLSDQEVTDIVAWLAGHRNQNPDQPQQQALTEGSDK